MRVDSGAAWAAFQARLVALGAQLLESEYLGTKIPHRAICAAGHPIAPRPGDVNRGIGICRVCAGKDQAASWSLFCRLVSERGGRVLESAPLGANTPHRVRCPEGHEGYALPSYVRVGGGMCVTCSPVSRVRAEQRFRDLVAALGGKLLEPTWLGTGTPHRVICSRGHETAPRPGDVRQTKSLCRICSGHDSATSWREFQARVAKLGGAVVEPAWLGNKKPHRVTCQSGHECTVRPNNVQQGSSICRTCAYEVWDVFYVVTSESLQMVKVGVTSHDARARLRTHSKTGFTHVVKTIDGLADAATLERKVLESLRAEGVAPARGRGYFDIATLPLIMGIVEGWQPAG